MPKSHELAWYCLINDLGVYIVCIWQIEFFQKKVPVLRIKLVKNIWASYLVQPQNILYKNTIFHIMDIGR